jgi:AAA domain-containing protein
VLERDGKAAGEAIKRIGPQLSCTTLAVQGPAGAGKTYAGSWMSVELVRAGKKLGITATSHKVIENLLAAVHEAAQEARDAGQSVRLFSIQKPKNDTPALEHPHNLEAKNNAHVASSLASGEVQVAAGTQWLWCDEKLHSSVDVLVVDEAGQFSLANALAVSVAANSLVLLGDPRQLSQPSAGSDSRRVATRSRLGTVDKFQGQEAPVVLYSMATSSPEDAPRGFDLLFSLNRLNVATSRWQGIVILVA